MQRLHPWIASAVLCLATAVQAASEIKPTGILQRHNQTAALFDEFFSPSPSQQLRFHRSLKLVRGELASSSNGMQRVSVTTIDPGRGLLELDRGGSNEVVRFKSPLARDRDGIILEDATIDQLLAVYSQLAGKNILPHPKLPEKLFTLTSEFVGDSAGAEILRKTLMQADTVLIPFSQSFEIAVPKSLADQKFDRTKFLKPKDPNARIEAGSLEMFGAPMDQMLDVCSDFLAPRARTRPVFGADNLQHEIRLVTAATIEEVTDALQLLFQWNGFRLVAEGDETFALKPIR